MIATIRRLAFSLFCLVTMQLAAQGSAYMTDFEPADGFSAGTLNSQGRWTVVQGAASIVTTDKFSGAQSLSLASGAPAATVRVNLGGTTSGQLGFVDFFVRPTALTEATTTTTIQTEQATLRFVRENDYAVLHYLDGDGQGSGTWRAGNYSTLLDANTGKSASWVRITLREDYGAHRWDLYVNGFLVGCRIGARSNTPTDLATLTWAGAASGGDTGVDDIYSGPENPLFTDQDRDGIDDAWETARGLNPAVNDRDADPDNDGGANIEEFLRNTDPAAHTLTITNAETAGISGFRALWNTPVPLSEFGAIANTLAEPGRADYGVAPTAFWLPENRQNGTMPGGLAFDAVHRSVLVKFPTAAQQIADKINAGFRIKKIELALPYQDTEFWPEGYRKHPWLSSLGGTWKNTPPRWHAIGWAIRRPWENDSTQGPTYNANINGVSYWEKYGAQGANDRFSTQFGPAEVSSAVIEGRMDITAIATDPSYGAMLADRLAVLNDQGVLVKKWETYDFFFWYGGYEGGTMTGHRGILIKTPKLVIEFETATPPDTVTPKPPLNLQTEIARVQQTGTGGTPTAMLPTQAEFDAHAAQFGAVKPAWMPQWQWQRIQELKNLPPVPGFAEDVKTGFPSTLLEYSDWIDSMLSIQPRRWAGFDAGKKAALYLRHQTALPEPVKDHWKLYWSSWIMPERPWLKPDGTPNFGYSRIFMGVRGS